MKELLRIQHFDLKSLLINIPVSLKKINDHHLSCIVPFSCTLDAPLLFSHDQPPNIAHLYSDRASAGEGQGSMDAES